MQRQAAARSNDLQMVGGLRKSLDCKPRSLIRASQGNLNYSIALGGAAQLPTSSKQAIEETSAMLVNAR
jgi:hypothetical protein